MSRTKNPTLRRRTKELSECAEDARECQLLGYELKDLGSLLVKMAIHMEDLQRKVDSQAEYIKTLNEDRKTKPSDSEKPNNCEDEPLTCDGNCWMKKQNGEWLCEHCQREPKTEPQTCANGCKWLNQYGECTEPHGECHIEYRTEVDEPQTEEYEEPNYYDPALWE